MIPTNNIIYAFLFISLIATVGCQSEISSENNEVITKPIVEPEKKRGPITVTGTITNIGNTKIKLTHQSTTRNTVVKDGQFKIDHLIEEPGIYQLVNNGQKIPLYLRPGDVATVNFDALKIAETIEFSGTDPTVQKYLYLKSLNNPLTYQEKRKAVTLSENEFMAQANANRDQQESFFEEYKKKHKDLAADFQIFEAAEIQYDWAKQYSDYKLYHAFYNQQETYTPSPELLAYTEKLDLNNDQLMVSAAYRNFLIAHVGQKVSDQVQKDLMSGGKIQSSLRAFETVEKEHSSPKVKSFLLYTFFNQHLRSKGINGSEVLYERFKKEVTNPAYLAEVDAAFQAWKHLRKGQPAPVFSYPDQQGKQVSLENLKGKVVYVDIWATWCGPCKTEIPHLEKLQEKFHGKAVEFVSVSIDKNAAAWEKMLKEKNMTGTQLIADRAAGSQICVDYKIKGIPRFLLIDQAGNIVNAQADRPSQGTVAKVIEGLLAG